MKSNVISTLGLTAAWFAISSCASTPPPNAQAASTQAAVQSARGAGAESAPLANTHLTRAENQLGQARALMNEGENKEAAAMLTRAEADAEFAAALAREAQQRNATEAAVQRVRSMQQQEETQQRQESLPSLGPSER